MLGLNRPTAIFIFLSIIVGLGTKEWKNGIAVFGVYAICMIIWRFLTDRR